MDLSYHGVATTKANTYWMAEVNIGDHHFRRPCCQDNLCSYHAKQRESNSVHYSEDYEKLARAIGMIIGGLAHDLQTPA